VVVFLLDHLEGGIAGRWYPGRTWHADEMITRNYCCYLSAGGRIKYLREVILPLPIGDVKRLRCSCKGLFGVPILLKLMDMLYAHIQEFWSYFSLQGVVV
jgi:hypothetical protein